MDLFVVCPCGNDVEVGEICQKCGVLLTLVKHAEGRGSMILKMEADHKMQGVSDQDPSDEGTSSGMVMTDLSSVCQICGEPISPVSLANAVCMPCYKNEMIPVKMDVSDDPSGDVRDERLAKLVDYTCSFKGCVKIENGYCSGLFHNNKDQGKTRSHDCLQINDTVMLIRDRAEVSRDGDRSD